MNRSIAWMLAVALSLTAALAMSACKTDQAGVKSTYRSQYATVDANVDHTAAAAEAALTALELKDVESSHTSVDGRVVGKLADKTKVTVSITRATDTTSEVSVNVGKLGDPELGKDILARIKKSLAE